jgi:hypothetical protein
VNGLRAAYRFKPGRTFAQALVAALLGNGLGVLDVDWIQALSVAGLAGVVSLLQIWGEGGDLLADDSRVTHTARHG